MNTLHKQAASGTAVPLLIHRFLAVTALALLLALGAGQAIAAQSGFTGPAAGGYTGPGPDIATVTQAKSMSDDARVALQGHIVQSLGDKEYLFKDETDSIVVEIGRKRWNGQEVAPTDQVEIHGEVDRDWAGVTIDVKRLIKR